VRCREIDESDVAAVIALLARGFPAAGRVHWVRALTGLANRPVPAGLPRFGYVLDDGGTLVGAILTVFSAINAGDSVPTVRCSLAGWFVEPAFRGYAVRLHLAALRRRDVTYVSTTAAPHVRPTIEAMGFRRYTGGQFIAAPVFGRTEPGVRVDALHVGDPLDEALAPDHALIADHLAYGCGVLVCTAADGLHPFIFRKYRRRGGSIALPLVRLVYCRDLADLTRFAGALGVHLLKRGVLGITLDADRPIDGLPGVFVSRGLFAESPNYFKGPTPPRPGDLAHTELAVFGP